MFPLTCSGTSSDRAHVILVELAQFGLAGRQSRDLRAQRLGSDHVQLRVPPHFVALHAQIPA